MSPVAKNPRDVLLAPVVSEKSYSLLDEGKYTFVVDPRANKTEIKIAVEDLLLRLVRKEFLTSYQQTLLGPFWVLLQPILTVITYVLVFNRVMGIPTDGVPSFLFYLIGITLWNLFSELFLNTSTVQQNLSVFSKVYFPRILDPFPCCY